MAEKNKKKDEEFIALWRKLGSPTLVAEATKTNPRSVLNRRASIEIRYGIKLPTHNSLRDQKKEKPKEGTEQFQAKTIIQGLESFFDLFLANQAEALKRDTNYADFKKLAITKMNLAPDVAFVDSAEDITTADALVKKYMTQQLAKYKYLQPNG